MQPKLLNRIIKINQKQLDEELMHQKSVISRIDEIKNHIITLQKELEREANFAQDNLDLAFSLATYKEDNTLRQAVLGELVTDLQIRLSEIKEKIINLNMDNKKFEILINTHQKKLQKETALKEQKLMDEFSMTRKSK